MADGRTNLCVNESSRRRHQLLGDVRREEVGREDYRDANKGRWPEAEAFDQQASQHKKLVPSQSWQCWSTSGRNLPSTGSRPGRRGLSSSGNNPCPPWRTFPHLLIWHWGQHRRPPALSLPTQRSTVLEWSDRCSWQSALKIADFPFPGSS